MVNQLPVCSQPLGCIHMRHICRVTSSVGLQAWVILTYWQNYFQWEAVDSVGSWTYVTMDRLGGDESWSMGTIMEEMG